MSVIEGHGPFSKCIYVFQFFPYIFDPGSDLFVLDHDVVVIFDDQYAVVVCVLISVEVDITACFQVGDLVYCVVGYDDVLDAVRIVRDNGIFDDIGVGEVVISQDEIVVDDDLIGFVRIYGNVGAREFACCFEVWLVVLVVDRLFDDLVIGLPYGVAPFVVVDFVEVCDVQVFVSTAGFAVCFGIFCFLFFVIRLV